MLKQTVITYNGCREGGRGPVDCYHVESGNATNSYPGDLQPLILAHSGLLADFFPIDSSCAAQVIWFWQILDLEMPPKQ